MVNSWPPMHARPISRQHKCRGKCPNALLGPGGTHKAFLVIVYQSHVLGAHWRQSTTCNAAAPPCPQARTHSKRRTPEGPRRRMVQPHSGTSSLPHYHCGQLRYLRQRQHTHSDEHHNPWERPVAKPLPSAATPWLGTMPTSRASRLTHMSMWTAGSFSRSFPKALSIASCT